MMRPPILNLNESAPVEGVLRNHISSKLQLIHLNYFLCLLLPVNVHCNIGYVRELNRNNLKCIEEMNNDGEESDS